MLSPKLQICLEHTANGLSEKEIARAMRISVNTIKSQRKLLLARLGARNSPHAVALGFRLGLLGVQ